MTLRPFSADLQQQFRTTLATPGAPETIDDSQPVVPVAVVASTPQAVAVTVTETKRTASILEGSRLGGVGTTVLGTVPAGTVWRILSVQMFFYTGAATSVGEVELNGQSVLVALGATAQTPIVSWEYLACPVLTAGQTVSIVTSVSGSDTYARLVYVSESA